MRWESMRHKYILLCSALLSACSENPQRPEAQACQFETAIPEITPSIPDSFVQSFPSGSHKRNFEDIQRTLNGNKSGYYSILNRSAKEPLCFTRYRLVVVMALDPAGHVAGAEALTRSGPGSKLEDKVLAKLKLVEFGPAGGDGYYVFLYPITFISQ